MTCVSSRLPSSVAASASSCSVPSPPMSTSTRSLRTCSDVYFEVYRAVIGAEKVAEATAARLSNRRLIEEQGEEARVDRRSKEKEEQLRGDIQRGRMGTAVDSKLQELRTAHLLHSGSVLYSLTPTLDCLKPIHKRLPILLFNDMTREEVQCIRCGGDELWPVRMVEDGSGVEFRSIETMTYKTAPASHTQAIAQATQQRADNIAHCEHLLHEQLPQALRNSERAMHELMAAAEGSDDDVSLSELGAMTIEQGRIRREMEMQQTTLDQLLNSPVPQVDLKSQPLEERQVFNQLTLSFADGGFNLIGGIRYQLVRQLKPLQMTLYDTLVEPTEIEGKPQP